MNCIKQISMFLMASLLIVACAGKKHMTKKAPAAKRVTSMKQPVAKINTTEEKVKKLVDEGAEYLAKGEYDKAIETSNRILELDNKNLDALQLRTSSYALQGSTNKAKEEGNKALSIPLNDDAKAYKARANVHSTLGEFDKSIEDYNKAIELNSDDIFESELYFGRGLTYRFLGEKKLAKEDYEKAKKLNPANVKSYERMWNTATSFVKKAAEVKAEKEAEKEAKKKAEKKAEKEAEKLAKEYKEYYEKEKKLNPSIIKTFIEYQNAASSSLKDGEIFVELTKIIQEDPNNAELYYNRGKAYYDKGKNKKAQKDNNLEELYNKAIEDYNKAIELNPEYYLAYKARGNAKDLLGDPHKAIKDYEKAISIKPDYAVAYSNIGLMYCVRLKDVNKGFEYYDKAIELGWNQSSAFFYVARYYSEITKQYYKSIEAYTKAIELKPEDAIFWYNRGYVYTLMKQYDKAIPDFNVATKIRPRFDRPYEWRANIYFKTKKYQKGINEYNTLIELTEGAERERKKRLGALANKFSRQTEIANFYRYRGDLYFELGNYAKALQDFNKAIELKPDLSWGFYGKGRALTKLGKINESIDTFNDYIKVANPKIERNIINAVRNEIRKLKTKLAAEENSGDEAEKSAQETPVP